MTKESGNVSAIVSSHGIKLHLFEPSKREIWTVVGKENEYWLDSNLGYCSCDDYYYNAMEKERKCYHLQAVIAAKEQRKVEIIKFQDSEFESFISALVQDMI